MFLQDLIHGSVEIEEKVLQELIESEPVQRLKGVHQGGASYLVNPNWNVTRYEHSIGVMLLIRRLGGSVEEQVAGLLHDVSHTAFSHVIDFVLDYEGEDYHEEIFERVLSRSEIPEIIERHGLQMEEVLDESRWKILEQPLPDLCADRIDYTLRDMKQQGVIGDEETKRFLQALRFNGEKVYVQEEAQAVWFVQLFYKEVIDYFLHPLNVYGYQVLAQVLRDSLQEGIMTKDDFLLKDEELLDKVKQAGKSEDLAHLHPEVEVEFNAEDYDYSQHGKYRYIDPLVMQRDGTLLPVSKMSSEVRKATAWAKERSEKGTYVKVRYA